MLLMITAAREFRGQSSSAGSSTKTPFQRAGLRGARFNGNNVSTSWPYTVHCTTTDFVVRRFFPLLQPSSPQCALACSPSLAARCSVRPALCARLPSASPGKCTPGSFFPLSGLTNNAFHLRRSCASRLGAVARAPLCAAAPQQRSMSTSTAGHLPLTVFSEEEDSLRATIHKFAREVSRLFFSPPLFTSIQPSFRDRCLRPK